VEPPWLTQKDQTSVEVTLLLEIYHHYGYEKSECLIHGTLTEGGRISTVDLLVLTSLDQLIVY
jgi:hypothetical protein